MIFFYKIIIIYNFLSNIDSKFIFFIKFILIRTSSDYIRSEQIIIHKDTFLFPNSQESGICESVLSCPYVDHVHLFISTAPHWINSKFIQPQFI